MRLGGLLFLFLLYGLAEIVLLVAAGDALGFLATFSLLSLGVIAGAGLLQASRLSLVRTMRRDLSEGRRPAADLLRGVKRALAGLLLIAPGFISDALAVAVLLLPWQTWFLGRTSFHFAMARRSGGSAGAGRIVDLEPGAYDRGSPFPEQRREEGEH